MTDGSDDERGSSSDPTPSESVEEGVDSDESTPDAAFDDSESIDADDAEDTASSDQTDSDAENAAEPDATDSNAENATEPDATESDATNDVPGGRTIDGPLGPADATDDETSDPDEGSDTPDGIDTGNLSRVDPDDAANAENSEDVSSDANETEPDEVPEVYRAESDVDGTDDTDDTTDTDDEEPNYTAEDFQTDVPDMSAQWSDEYDAPTPGTEPGDGPPDGTTGSDATADGDTNAGGDTAGASDTATDGDRAVTDGAAPSIESGAVADGAAPGSAAEAGMVATEGATAETEAGGATGTGTAGAGVGDDEAFEGPESDEEMPLTDHIEEMMRRLSVVVAVGSVVSLGVLVAGIGIDFFPSAEEIIVFLWDHHVDFQEYRPYVYGPLEFLLTKLKVAGLAGVVVSLPVFVYETYRFMRPGLYPNERRYYLAAVPTSLVLALVGVAFAHFVVLPAIFQYFITYTAESAQLAFGLRETFNLILLMMGYMAIVFQIPLFIQLAIMMGLVTRRWLEQRRLLFWGSFLGLSFLVSPDPTGMAPIIVTATMIALFEGTLLLIRWTDR